MNQWNKKRSFPLPDKVHVIRLYYRKVILDDFIRNLKFGDLSARRDDSLSIFHFLSDSLIHMRFVLSEIGH